jgi:hypothetical protein
VPLYLQKIKKIKKLVSTMAETKASAPSTPLFHDPNHHLYIHHSDHPGVVLVSQPFNGENYQIWS